MALLRLGEEPRAHFGVAVKKAVRGRDLVVVEHDGERFAAPPGGVSGPSPP